MNHINQSKVNRYQELQETIKQAEKELSELKSEFIASNGGESDLHYVVIKDNFRESVASKKLFEEKFGVNWLKDNGMLSLSAFNTVVISQKLNKGKAA